jgi:hypothetical protein
MHAGLARVEVDEALELGEVEAVAHVDDLLDAANPDSGQAHLGGGPGGLDVAASGWNG